MIRKLLTNSAIYGIAPNIPKVAAIFILPLLTAHLTEIDYGIAGTITAYTLALSAFSTLGFSAVLQIYFFRARQQHKILWREIYGFLQYWMIAFAIIQSAVLYFIIPAEAEENRWTIILLTNFNGVLFGPASWLGPLYYQLNQQPLPIVVRNILAGFLTLLINYVTIVVCEWGYMGWYVSSFMGVFLVNASYWYSLNHRLGLSPIYRFKLRTIRKQMKVALPTIPHYYSVFLLNSSNRLVMDWAKIGLGPIGEYNMAQQITTYVETGVNAIERAAGPMCMNAIRDDKEQEAKRYIYCFTALAFGATFLIALWSREIFGLLIRNEVLSRTYPYAAVLILALSYRPMYLAASNYFFYYEKTLKLLYVTFGAGLIAFLANLLFIPRYGIWAAVIINYAAFLYQGYSGFLFREFKEKAKTGYSYKRILLLQLFLTAICLLFLESSAATKIIVSSVLGTAASIAVVKYLRK